MSPRGDSPWIRVTDPKAGKTCQRWRLEGTTIELRHCGHPTALWPWYATAEGTEGLIVSGTGRGWRRLAEAKADLEAWIAGERETVRRTSPHGPLTCILAAGETRVEALVAMRRADERKR